MSNSINQKIKELLLNKRMCFWIRTISKHSDILKYINELLNNNNIFKDYIDVLFCIVKDLDINNLDKCLKCGNTLSINKIRSNKKYCCKKCSDTSIERSEKIKNTKSSEESKQQYRDTCLNKYGVDNVTKCKDISKKISNKHKSHSIEYKDYINKKRKNTFLQKYNVEHALQSKEIVQQMKDKELLLHNVEHHTKRKDYNKNFNLISYDRFKRFSKYVIPLFSSEEFISNGANPYDIEYKWKCLKCNNEFYSKITRHKGYIPRCIKCYPSAISKYEDEIIEFLKRYDIPLIKSDRTIIKPQELDIVIPHKKVAIEFNGNYWHSELVKDENYHLDKTNKCLKNNYRLIHIFEDEWIYKKQIVKSKLKSILGLISYKIYARKCYVAEISNNIKKQFLEKYHIQGDCNDSTRLGLFYKNRLVGVMTFGNCRFNKNNNDVELIRYSTISNFNIIGGAGKLLSYYKKHYNTNKCSIISYADKRWSIGNLYKQLGFILCGESKPNYWYIHKNNLYIRYSRMNFQKHKLNNKLKIFNRHMSEYENMKNNDYIRIYDCGNFIFKLS